MTGSIRLHKEYGLNPTISSCIICGKEKNEIALLGASYKEQAPMHMVTSIEPCEKCHDKYLKKGTMLVEAEKDEHGHIIPTGRIAVIKDEAYKRMVNIPAPKKIAFIEKEAFERMGLDRAKRNLKDVI